MSPICNTAYSWAFFFFYLTCQSLTTDCGIETIYIMSNYWKILIDIVIALLFCHWFLYSSLLLNSSPWLHIFMPIRSLVIWVSLTLCRVSLSIFHSAVLVVINHLRFCLEENCCFSIILTFYFCSNFSFLLVYVCTT